MEASGLIRRAIAALIDAIVVGTPVVSAVRIGAIPGWVGLAINGVYATVLVAWRGQTLGMMALSIEVVNESDGGVPGPLAAFVHWAAFLGPGLIPSDNGLVALLQLVWTVVVLASMVFDPLRRGLHDRAAGTIVVLSDWRRGAARSAP